MTERENSFGYLYINGLGDGRVTTKDMLVQWWWAKRGIAIHHAQVNWYDDESLDTKLESIGKQIDSMLQTFGGVAIIGSSAGGSLAVNAFNQLKDKNVCAIVAHGRVKKGKYPRLQRMSLYRAAHLDTKKPSQSFYASVIQLEDSVIPKLSEKERERLLVLTQLTDMVVPLGCAHIEGVEEHRSLAFGHSGGFLAHLFADRDLIVDFANTRLGETRV